MVKAPLKLPSNMVVEFEDGAEIKAMRGYFKGIGDCLLMARNCKNLILRGKGIGTMNKSDYQNAKEYKPAEWRHTLGLFGCDNVKVEGLTLRSSGGDGIYVHTVKDLLVDNVVLDDHHRQGVSVIGAENLLIRNSLIKNTKGTAPQCGIDFEPNGPKDKLVNCRVENCRFENNANSAINVTYTNVVSTTTLIDIVMENCLFQGGNYGVSFLQMQNGGKESTAKGRISYKNCRIDSPSSSAMHVDTIRSTGPEIVFENLVVSQQNSAVAPIYFYVRKFLNENCGNLKFINCNFSAPKAENVLDCVNYSTGVLEKIDGAVIFNGASVDLPKLIKTLDFNQKPPSMSLKKVDVATLVPAGFNVKPTGEPCLFTVRGNVDIILYAKKNTEVVVALEYLRLGAYQTPPLELTLIEPDGKKLQFDKLEYKKKQTQEFRFTPAQNGAYILKVPNNINCVSIKKISVPWAVFSRKRSGLYNLLTPHGAIYFALPAKVETFWFEVAGNGGKETVDATVEVDGTVIAEAKNISRSKYFHLNLQPADKPRLVKLSVTARGGCFVTFPEPLWPMFSNSPENVFIERQL
jgi:hypothetical protein